MMTPPRAAVVRRAILDLLEEIGGEHNDDELHLLLIGLGHRIARADVADSLTWLAAAELVRAERLGPFVVARILSAGRDVASGLSVVEGIHRHKTGE
ncbi:hypothetical protein [Sphingomonas sp. SORGH_AS_0879]|uniref:hypothetical protein n=1 Tax=Sphingomonas sp. SORGH_AS_0879 TaxID=3041790 RepID=UPI002782B53E|nr:hypothetical protein [Sphingomonas sp. SORGH_AS_0879]MDQ1229303.1 Fe2+ or Zn2+ uptake regulation protein [Sphingomonas sp. SORGH_AS_0879]